MDEFWSGRVWWVWQQGTGNNEGDNNDLNISISITFDLVMVFLFFFIFNIFDSLRVVAFKKLVVFVVVGVVAFMKHLIPIRKITCNLELLEVSKVDVKDMREDNLFYKELLTWKKSIFFFLSLFALEQYQNYWFGLSIVFLGLRYQEKTCWKTNYWQYLNLYALHVLFLKRKLLFFSRSFGICVIWSNALRSPVTNLEIVW